MIKTARKTLAPMSPDAQSIYDDLADCFEVPAHLEPRLRQYAITSALWESSMADLGPDIGTKRFRNVQIAMMLFKQMESLCQPIFAEIERQVAQQKATEAKAARGGAYYFRDQAESDDDEPFEQTAGYPGSSRISELKISRRALLATTDGFDAARN